MRNDVHFSIVYQCTNLETAELPNNRILMYLWYSPVTKAVHKQELCAHMCVWSYGIAFTMCHVQGKHYETEMLPPQYQQAGLYTEKHPRMMYTKIVVADVLDGEISEFVSPFGLPMLCHFSAMNIYFMLFMEGEKHGDPQLSSFKSFFKDFQVAQKIVVG